MKIRYNEDFDCYMTTECHKTDIIELDGVKLIPITELDKIKAEIAESFSSSVSDCIYIIDNRISELKGENTNE